MANTIQKNTIIDGPRHTVVQVWLASDGVAGELSDEVIVDVSALSVAAGQTSISKLVVEEVKASFTGFSGNLEFDRTTNQGIIGLPDGNDVDINYCKVGGFQDNGSGSTGDVVLNTSGFATAGDEGSLVVKVRKKYTT